MDCSWMEQKFEKLKLHPSRYEGKSPRDWKYNCIAWAMGKKDKPWWPATFGGYHWPKSLPRQKVGEETLANFIRAFKRLRYNICLTKDYSLEKGFEKIVIYVKGNQNPTHAARLLPSGLSTSKIGDEEDIEHVSPADLEGSQYGSVAVVMKRSARI
jgi:hypothetical protein